VEGTIGYEALFSSEEWDSLDLPDETFLDNLTDFSSGAATSGSGCAAPNGAVPEGSSKHVVTIYNPPGQYEGNEARHELECERCDYIGAAESRDEADGIARLHEEFVAPLLEKWGIN
jgi:hypothetical protein